ncbi:MAG: putative hydro-lyase [Synergistaceae bacterium]|jgi:uncharacterized protein YcsI (UPF0317 family)|nr:putative hydro-lyase [Synergistaceae bacterium]
MANYAEMSPKDLRRLIREQKITGETSGMCSGFVQANLVILAQKYAEDFRKFAERNPKPCPILEITEPGDPFLKKIADHADIRTDIPRYRVFRNGVLVDEPYDITGCWQNDFVCFLIGCSFSFENALTKAGIEIRNIVDGHMVSVYKTCIPCAPAGIFKGPVVATMRPVPESKVDLAYEVTGRLPHVHGMPLYHGDPSKLGVDLNKPDWGVPTRFNEGEVPVFWACGVTPQAAIENAKPDLVITHTPACMLVADIKDEELEEKLFGCKEAVYKKGSEHNA